MNKTERLLHLLKILSHYHYAVTGKQLADRLGVSIRTLYRDIAALQAMGAEIEGETGVGYILKPTFFLPPLMFTQTELQALLLGTQWVSQYGDAPLSEGANDALKKVFNVLPIHVKKDTQAFTLRVGPPPSVTMRKEDLSIIRAAIAKQNKIHLTYQSKESKEIQYVIWPFTIGYFTDRRILVAWSEEENNYRHFKTDKIISLSVLNEHYAHSKTSLFREWQAMQQQKYSPNRE
jgi:predicted DNA-binding transcriptional regulator YafY